MLGHIYSYPWLHDTYGQQVQFRKKCTASFLPKHRREASEGEQTQKSSVTVKNNLELQGKPAGTGEWDICLT